MKRLIDHMIFFSIMKYIIKRFGQTKTAAIDGATQAKCFLYILK